jgi:hypothetical protein
MKYQSYINIYKTLLLKFTIILCISVTAHADSKWESFIADIKEKSKIGDEDSKGILSSFIEMDGIGGSYNEALELATDSSAANSFYGHYSLGKLFKNGRGVIQNSNKANDLFNKSLPSIMKEAENGNPVCQYLAAECYNYGHGVDLNPKKAEKWSKESIKNGLNIAHHQLALSYLNQEKTDKYISNLKISAECGFAASQLSLYGVLQLYTNNQNDINAAKAWYQKAEKQNCASLTKSNSSQKTISAGSNTSDIRESRAIGIADTILPSNSKDSKSSLGNSKSITITSEQVNYLKSELIHLFKEGPLDAYNYALQLNENNEWGPDGESILMVKTDAPPYGGISQLWWPKNETLAEVRNSSINKINGKIYVPYDFYVRKINTEDKMSKPISFSKLHGQFVAGNSILYFRMDKFNEDHWDMVDGIFSNVSYAIDKCIKWGNEIRDKNASDTCFVKEIKSEDGDLSGFCVEYNGDGIFHLLIKNGRSARVNGVPFSGRDNGGLTVHGAPLYVNGIGYTEIAAGDINELEKLKIPIKYYKYLRSKLETQHKEQDSIREKKNTVIDSLN